MSKYVVQPRTQTSQSGSFSTLEAAIQSTQGKTGVFEILEVASHLVIANQSCTATQPTKQTPKTTAKDDSAPFGRDSNGTPIARYGYKTDGTIKKMPGRKFRTKKPAAKRIPHSTTAAPIPTPSIPTEVPVMEFTIPTATGNGQPTS